MFLANVITFPKNLFVSNSRPKSLERQLVRKHLTIGLEMNGDDLVIYLLGKLDATNAPLFKNFVKTLTENHNTGEVAFDLAGIKSLDGAGVAALVWANNYLSGRVSVVNPSHNLYQKLVALNFQYLVKIDTFSLVA